MAVEVGRILEGKVCGIKNFGAFVELADGTTGMVHISEVSNGYVEHLSDVLQDGQVVKVRVMAVSPEGKVALSIKKAQPKPKPTRGDPGRTWQPKVAAPKGEIGFEDMMAKFKSQSEENISDLKRVTEAHRGGGYTRRGR